MQSWPTESHLGICFSQDPTNKLINRGAGEGWGRRPALLVTHLPESRPPSHRTRMLTRARPELRWVLIFLYLVRAVVQLICWGCQDPNLLLRYDN